MTIIYIVKPPHSNLPPNDILALGELIVEYTLREKIPHIISIKWSQDSSIVYGYYEACREAHINNKVWRRITGGFRAETKTDTKYTAITIPGYSSLREIVDIAERTSQETGAVFGATVFEATAFLEFFHSSELDPKDLLWKLGVSIAKIVERHIENRDSLVPLANTFLNHSWRCFKFNSTQYSARKERGKYWLEISLEKTGPYITNYWLSGVFYASPPSEIFNILNSLRGSRFNEIQLYNIELGFKKRVNVAGIELNDIIELIHELYKKAGDKD